MAKRKEAETITWGSGNVFADLGFENPEEELAKADLVLAIARIMGSMKVTQATLAKNIGIDQPQVSRLLRGHTEGYSIERLMRILKSLGQSVEITVRTKQAPGTSRGKVFVVMPPPSKSNYGTARKAVRVASSGRTVSESKGKYAAKSAKKK